MAIACNRIVCRIPPTCGHNGQNEPSNQTQGSSAIRGSKLQGPKICHVLSLRPKPTKKDKVFQLAPAIIGHAQPCLATAQNAPGNPWLPSLKTGERPDCRTHILRQKTRLPSESRFRHAVGQRMVSLHQFFHHLCRRDNRIDLATDLTNLQFPFL